MRLFIREYYIHLLVAAKSVISNAQQAVLIRRKINPRHLWTLVRHYIQKSGVLMCEPIVILPPHQGRDQQVDRRYRSSLTQFELALLKPLRMLIEH